jgi:hypothetical protein
LLNQPEPVASLLPTRSGPRTARANPMTNVPQPTT